VHCVHGVLRCGYKSTVKLLFTPPARGVGISTQGIDEDDDGVEEGTVDDEVEVVDDVVVDVVDDEDDDEDDDDDDDDVEEQVEDGEVESTADAGSIRYGPKKSNAMTVNNAMKRIFINMTITIFMKSKAFDSSS
jgi:hypothetical protein